MFRPSTTRRFPGYLRLSIAACIAMFFGLPKDAQAQSIGTTVPSAAVILSQPMPPPIGYVGPVPSSTPPMGYIGPVVSSPAATVRSILDQETNEPEVKPPNRHPSSLPPQVKSIAPVVASSTSDQTASPIPAPHIAQPLPSIKPLTSAAALEGLSTTVLTSAPPLGYTGPVSRSVSAITVTGVSTMPASTSPPPIGYVGPVSSSLPSFAPGPQLPDPESQTLITARQMVSNDAAGIVTATGRVEIAHGGYILHADKVTYDKNTGVMHAEGNVALLTPNGSVEFAEQEEITGDMKQAFAKNVGVLFPDNSRMTARISQRYDERYSTADKTMFTACNVCKADPNNPPLWQIRAEQAVHDNVDHDIFFHDATLDFAGVPILWSPYFSAPDPTVDRRQGFLSMTPGVTTNLGAFVRVPYYFDIAPNTDAILAPTFSAKDDLQLGGEFRHRFENGNMQFTGSFTHTDLISDAGVDEGNQWRGNLLGNVVYNIDNVWRAGTDVDFASDKSYLERYNISSMQALTNRAYLEGFKGRDYAAINSYYFEDLRPGSQPVQPLVLPQASFSALGEPGQTFGGRWSLDSSMLVTERNNSGQSEDQQGPDTRRVSVNTGWERQFVSDTGLLATVSGLARADNYWADNVINPDGSGSNFDNVLLSRPFAQGNVVVRYPMGRSGDGYQQIVEPIAAFTAAPNVKNDPRTPIEESLDVEFDETNLFSPNRFTGNDLIEGGSRATWGVRHAITAEGGARVDMFGGESYDFSSNPNFPGLSGLRDQVSDYVGRIDFTPTDWFDLNYGFRLDHNTLAPQRQDARVSVGTLLFRPYVRYISAYQAQTQSDVGIGAFDAVEEGIVGFDSHFLKYWLLHAEHTQAFEPEPGSRSTSVTFGYTDECFIVGVTAQNTNTNRLDLSSGTSVVFHIYLKSVGGVHTDSFTNAQFPVNFRQTD